MRIIFMGTPDFAVPSLEALAKSDHEILAVYTQPDRKRGRGQKYIFSPVKEKALEYGLPVCQPTSLRTEDEYERLLDLRPQAIIVAAYGMILPEKILSLPQYGCINIHASLLPRHRGASPIHHAILMGDEKTGITIMQMDKGIDTGDMLLKKELVIDKEETSISLTNKLKLLAGPLLLEALDLIEKNKISPKKQDDSEASYTGLLTREMAKINWDQSSEDVDRQIRAMLPASHTFYKGKRLKILRAKPISNESSNADIGQVEVARGEMLVRCKYGSISVLEIQAENKRPMDIRAFLNGNPIVSGDRLE